MEQRKGRVVMLVGGAESVQPEEEEPWTCRSNRYWRNC